MENLNICAIIAAGGLSRRLGEDKLFASLDGKPILARVVEVFEKCTLIDRIVVVVNEKNIARCRKVLAEEKWTKVTDICPGGERRQDSVAAGLKRLSKCDWAVIHDGARPLLTADLIQRGLEAARETGAAIAAVHVKDTIKVAGDDKIVKDTPPRENLWAVQTPQVFRFDLITKAYREARGDVTDDAALVEQLGYKVKLYDGSYNNLKITTPEDLALAQVLWQKRGDVK